MNLESKSNEFESGEYRYMTATEAQRLHSGQRVPALSRLGKIVGIKVNGKPKTWKTRPGHVKVPFKYGLYEHGCAESYGSLGDPCEPLLVKVNQ